MPALRFKDEILNKAKLDRKLELNELLNKPTWRWARYFRDILLDVFLVQIGFYLALYLAYTGHPPLALGDYLLKFSLPLLVVSALVLTWRGAHRINARYMGFYDFINLSVAGLFMVGAVIGIQSLLHTPQTVQGFAIFPLLFGYFSLTLLSGVRLALRHYNWQFPNGDVRRFKRRRTLVIGAGDAGEMIVREMNRSHHSEHTAVAFVDDDKTKVGSSIHGVKVIGTTDQIPYLVTEHSIDDIILAIANADGGDIRRIVDLCDRAGVRVRVLPPVAQILSHENHVRHYLREVDIEDLLRRQPVQTDTKRPAAYINAETVLITGGGGSIGSELTRQIAQFSPSNLILLGKGENSVYEIEQELIQTLGYAPTCVIGDIRDRQAIEFLFQKYRPTVVFHAAAHKHVPLMQNNPAEAIKNNVFGTELICDLSVKYGVRKFVYISTDKAVNPSSVMGATKRVGELIVRAYAQRSETEFAIVRFGNVLGSRGSLIPVLKKQIKQGGPVRLTHPDMTRYFMTIPEAVQLILQAGSMGKTGELYILDMGEPVKIVELAKDLIRLHGLVPGDDIEIQFMGVRPGEKTHEELVYAEEELQATDHPKIRSVRNEGKLNEPWLRAELDNLRRVLESDDTEKTRSALMELAWGKSAVPYQFAAVEASEIESDAPLG